MESESNYYKFYLENFYEKIADLTFKTYFFPLSAEETDLIINFQNYRYKKSYQLTEKDFQILKNLESKIDEFMIKLNYPQGFFIKMNFRSPKDGFPLKNSQIPLTFDSELSKILNKWNYDSWKKQLKDITKEDFLGNAKWIALIVTLFKLSICQNGKEVLNLLLSSLRIYEDIGYFVNEKNKVYIAFREFDSEISPTLEFRCVIKGNQLKAVMQYNHPWLIEELLSDSFVLSLKEKINTFWLEKIKDRLILLENYVMDIALIEKENFKVVELNPIGTSGLGLLKKEDWDNNSKDIVFKVRKDLEIPYHDHWEGELKYLMIDYCSHENYYKFLGWS